MRVSDDVERLRYCDIRDNYAILSNLFRNEVNVVDAAAAGASNAVSLAANIAANLIAFIALLTFINATLTWFGQRVGIEELTFQV